MNKLKKLTSQRIEPDVAMKAALLARRYTQLKVGHKEVIQHVMALDRSQILEILTMALSKPVVINSTRCAS